MTSKKLSKQMDQESQTRSLSLNSDRFLGIVEFVKSLFVVGSKEKIIDIQQHLLAFP